MSASLDEAKCKVQWGEKHFSDFKDIVLGRSTGEDTRKTTVVHYNLRRQSKPAHPQFLAPPRECRLAFGDAIHQLRSALDHITYAMVKPITQDPDVLRKVDFPIFVKVERFDESRSVKLLRKHLGPEQFAAILDTQPYKRAPSAPQMDPLWVLSELDNIDKHRTILVVDSRLMTKWKMVDGTTKVVKQPLVPGAQGFSFPLPVPQSPDEVEVQETSLTIVLSETGLAWEQNHLWRLARPRCQRQDRCR